MAIISSIVRLLVVNVTTPGVCSTWYGSSDVASAGGMDVPRCPMSNGPNLPTTSDKEYRCFPDCICVGSNSGEGVGHSAS